LTLNSFPTIRTIPSSDQSLFSLSESFNTFLVQREDTLRLLQIPLYESKAFDHKSVHSSFTLFNMLIEMMTKEIRLGEIDLFIRASRGCEWFFGHKMAVKLSEAVGSLSKVLFQSREFIQQFQISCMVNYNYNFKKFQLQNSWLM